jgi:transcription elongation factor Elf1
MGMKGDQMNKKPLTDAQYIKNPTVCPSCQGKDVSGGPVEVDAGTAWQEVTCLACEATWKDLYKLTGYTELNQGTTLYRGHS